MGDTEPLSNQDNRTLYRRSRINPIEVLILGSVTLLLGKGILDLFDAKALTAGTQFSTAAPRFTAGRSPAAARNGETAIPPRLAQLEVRCDTGKLETASSRVRLSGILCGFPESSKGTGEPRRILKSQVFNQANQYQAAVFSDLNSGKFTTDYIPLVSGANPFKVEFQYAGGKASTQEVVIQKN
jgi:hypothetical protein